MVEGLCVIDTFFLKKRFGGGEEGVIGRWAKNGAISTATEVKLGVLIGTRELSSIGGLAWDGETY